VGAGATVSLRTISTPFSPQSAAGGASAGAR